jgi:hypothetical protein
LLELDPRQRHARYQVDEVADLAALWRAFARLDTGPEGQAEAEAVYPLAGSIRARQEALGKLPPEMRLQMEQYIGLQQVMAESGRNGRLALSLANHKLLLATLRMMGAGGAGDREE